MESDISILIADDHFLIAKLVKVMLTATDEKYMVSTVNNGNDVLEFIKNFKLDILILDIDMPEIDGITVLKRVKLSNPEIKVLMVSNHTQAWIIKRALKYGANGYVSKYSETEEIIEGINAIQNNKVFLCRTATDCLNSKDNTEQDTEYLLQTRNRINNLSRREIDILKLVLNECSSKEISDILCISIRTVETHRKHILSKLGIKNSIGLIKLFIESDLLNLLEEN